MNRPAAQQHALDQREHDRDAGDAEREGGDRDGADPRARDSEVTAKRKSCPQRSSMLDGSAARVSSRIQAASRISQVWRSSGAASHLRKINRINYLRD